MVNEKDRYLENIKSILEHNVIKTPKQLATAYLDMKRTNKESNLPLQETSSISRIIEMCANDGEEYMAEYYRTRLDEMRREVMDGWHNPKYKTILERNYPEQVVNLVLDAIIDFESPIFLVEDAKKFIEELKVRNKLPRQDFSSVVRACATILTKGLISEQEKTVLEAVKRRHEIISKISGMMKSKRKINVLQAVQLYEELFVNIGIDEDAYKERLSNHAIMTLVYNLIFEKGRPPDLFLKALIRVICTLLSEPESDATIHYESSMKRLAADIINESYGKKGLKKLTEKDIDNSLHSA